MRNLGHSGIDGDVALREAINAGSVPGPRLQASARKLTPVGGYFQRLNAAAEPLQRDEFFEVDSADHGRRAVQENIFYGADAIKVVADDGITSAAMKAIVEEAHRARFVMKGGVVVRNDLTPTGPQARDRGAARL